MYSTPALATIGFEEVFHLAVQATMDSPYLLVELALIVELSTNVISRLIF
jgi:hypothetical protein